MFGACRDADELCVIDDANDSVIARVVTGDMPQNMVWNPDNQCVYVANWQGGSLSVIDAVENRLVANIAVGANPITLTVVCSESLLYCTNRTSNTVSVIDCGINQVVATVRVGVNPLAQALITRYNRVVSVGESDNRLVAIDCRTNRIWDDNYVGLSPFYMAWLDSERKLYCACPLSDAIAVLENGIVGSARLIRVAGGPYRVLSVPGRQRVYTNLRDSNCIGVIDAAADSLVKTLIVGNGPAFLCYLSSLGNLPVSCSEQQDFSKMRVKPTLLNQVPALSGDELLFDVVGRKVVPEMINYPGVFLSDIAGGSGASGTKL